MNQAVKTHWKLARRSLVKAIYVTFQSLFAILRSRRHSFKIAEDLQKSRHELKVMLNLEEQKSELPGFRMLEK